MPCLIRLTIEKVCLGQTKTPSKSPPEIKGDLKKKRERSLEKLFLLPLQIFDLGRVGEGFLSFVIRRIFQIKGPASQGNALTLQ